MAEIDWTTKAGTPTTMVLNNLSVLGSHNITAAHPDLLEHVALGLLGGVHDHEGVYSSATHAHASTYATLSHTHEGTYSSAAHAHEGVYSSASHTHAGGSRLPQSVSLGGYTVLTNITSNYDGIAPSRGLGVGLVDFTGVTSAQLQVYVDKVGTGTQSWQLWNVTDGSEVMVASDAGTTGVKVLSAATTVIPAGVKLVRIRAKSATAADDPIYLGGTVLLS